MSGLKGSAHVLTTQKAQAGCTHAWHDLAASTAPPVLARSHLAVSLAHVRDFSVLYLEVERFGAGRGEGDRWCSGVAEKSPSTSVPPHGTDELLPRGSKIVTVISQVRE
jgi:hypothetical protein